MRRAAWASALGVCLASSAALGTACREVAGIEDIALTCENTQTDTNNCGACGHSCLGAECNAGVCQPAHLFTQPNDGGPFMMMLDGGNVYVGYFFSIWGCAISPTVAGCASPPVQIYALNITNSPINLLGFTAAGKDVYFLTTPAYLPDGGVGTQLGSLFRVGTDGTGLRMVTGGQAEPFFAAATATDVLWTNREPAKMGGEVNRCPRQGPCTATAITPTDHTVSALFTTATDLYYPTNGSSPSTGAIRSCPLASPCPSPKVLYEGPAVDGDGLFAFDGASTFASLTTGGDLSLIDVGGAAQVTPIDKGIKWDFINIPTVGLDDTYVYLTSSDRIKRYTRATGARASDVAVGQPEPVAFAVDATAIYWTNNDGSAWRLAK